MRYLIVLCALVWSTVGVAQGVVPVYGARVEVFYRAASGRFPMEEMISPPAYPSEMRRAALEDTVSFSIVVGENGRVTEVTVREAKSPAFRRAVREALLGWRFRPLPATSEAGAAPVQLRGEIRFRIVED